MPGLGGEVRKVRLSEIQMRADLRAGAISDAEAVVDIRLRRRNEDNGRESNACRGAGLVVMNRESRSAGHEDRGR